MSEENGELFEQFKNSFSYGSRTDLNFKFLKMLPPDSAADFFQQLLWKLGDAMDSGDYDPVREHVIQGQIQAYGPNQWTYDDTPHSSLIKPLEEATIALLTSTGHFPKGVDPEPFGEKGMTQAEAARRISDFLKLAPELIDIPTTLGHEDLSVRHGGYDIRGVQADRNVALPIDRLREMADEGVFGRFHDPAYSFNGACAQTPLKNKIAPQWVDRLRTAGVDGLILVPV